MIDLLARTRDVLDTDSLLTALSERARTPLGAAAARQLAPLASAEAIRRIHDGIDELRAIEAQEGGGIPVGGVTDIRETAKRAGQGAILDGPALREAAGCLSALRGLAHRIDEAVDIAPILNEISSGIQIEAWIVRELVNAFDQTGQLSAATYPELGELRTTILKLHETIRRTLDELVKGDELGDLLQDRFVTTRSDRYVIPIKAHAKNWDLGIVHGTSGSGRTVFVEPNEVIALNNRLRLAEGALQAVEHRIYTTLSQRLGRVAPQVQAALDAATAIDLLCARDTFARALTASRPLVGETGVIDLHKARHPVLLLRGVPVVGNDLQVTPAHPILVLTGPNTGGKTVALKTLALCAWLASLGCFVPADEGSRVDLFPTLIADIGDTQTVHGDLSSFSGHLTMLKATLDAAASEGSQALIVLDELCSGTDPAQGGALARAVLERLLTLGARVVVTTHYAQLKGLAEVDTRFSLAAMEYRNGRPTYRVLAGTAGESHALDTALRMGLPDDLVERARGLMDHGERALQDALAALDTERYRAQQVVVDTESLREQLATRERVLLQREQAVAYRAKELEEAQAAKFLDRLKNAEKAVAAVVADLQRAPDHKRVESARTTLAALRTLVPGAPAPGPVLAAPDVGDRVRLRSLGQTGELIALGDSATVRIGNLTVKVRYEELERIDGQAESRQTPAPMKRQVAARASIDLGDALRMPHNTLDLRGERVDESFDLVDRFITEAGRRGLDVVFLLHGHGTGALKDALRRWLPTHAAAGKFAPANSDQGGDAYTVVEVR